MPFLETRQLSKRFGSVQAVDSLDLRVETGSTFGLLGPNGAGKSTTMNLLCGLLAPDSGEIFLHGEPFVPSDPEHRRRLGVVPQDLALYPDLTAAENLHFFGRLQRLRGNDLHSAIERVLDNTQLVDVRSNRVETFSGGMKRRLNLGVALLHAPELLILDEPTVGVDPQSRSHLLDCVRRLAESGTTVIYASHYMEEVQVLCDQVAIMDHGRLLVCDTTESLLQRVAAQLEFAVTSGEPIGKGELSDDVTVNKVDDQQWRLLVRPAMTGSPDNDRSTQSWNESLARVLDVIVNKSATIESISSRDANLERLFLDLTGRTLRDGQ